MWRADWRGQGDVRVQCTLHCISPRLRSGQWLRFIQIKTHFYPFRYRCYECYLYMNGWKIYSWWWYEYIMALFVQLYRANLRNGIFTQPTDIQRIISSSCGRFTLITWDGVRFTKLDLGARLRRVIFYIALRNVKCICNLFMKISREWNLIDEDTQHTEELSELYNIWLREFNDRLKSIHSSSPQVILTSVGGEDKTVWMTYHSIMMQSKFSYDISKFWW